MRTYLHVPLGDQLIQGMKCAVLVAQILLLACALTGAQRGGGGLQGKKARFSQAQSQRFSRADSCSTALSEGATATLATSKELVERLRLSPAEATSHLENSERTLSELGISGCHISPDECELSSRECRKVSGRYRTADGTCNNRVNSLWGTSHIAFRRALSPRYDDGVGTPRTLSVDGHSLLPNARLVSTTVHDTRSDTSNRHSLYVMQWGQFLDHDLTLTPIVHDSDGEPVACCGNEWSPACFTIEIPSGDKLRRSHPDGCIDVTRSQPTTTEPCTLDVRQQINQLTSYIDASNCYGSTNEMQRGLRTFHRGQLLSQPNPFNRGLKEWLPDETGTSECINSHGDDVPCFHAGDTRASEQAALTSFHTVWLREHNRLAKDLYRINPRWDDERLFQETRAIVAAMHQQISYGEFLPLVLGQELMVKHDLVLTNDYSADFYDPGVNAGIFNVFGTAAFRFGHTLLTDQFLRQVSIGAQSRSVDLSDTFFMPEIFNGTFPRGPDPLLVGLCGHAQENFDNLVTSQVRDRLFVEPGEEFGVDLMALNIQRGRDHGLPGYNEWRQWCRLGKVKDFTELQYVLRPGLADKFSALYASVDDIDLWSAGISENLVSADAQIGETFGCILARQFSNLRYGDRFWYENTGHENSFTRDQLAEIRKVKLSKVVCTNTDSMFSIQPKAMLLPDEFGNRVRPCEQLPAMSVEPWRERRPGGGGQGGHGPPPRTPRPPTHGGGTGGGTRGVRGRARARRTRTHL